MTKQINFTIVPDEPGRTERPTRAYANFCAVAHTPFDMTLTFCDVQPLTEQDIRQAEQSQTVRAPIVARIALPFNVVPGLIAALQGAVALRAGGAGRRAIRRSNAWPKGPLH